MLTLVWKQIWNKRRSNGWLLTELFIVFVILWYVLDFLFTSFVMVHQPKGYDTDHVYQVSIFQNPSLSSEYNAESLKESFLQIFNQVKEYPGVQSACYYAGSIPYENRMFQGYTTDSIHVYRANISMVNKDFFEVFKVQMFESNLSEWDITSYPRPALISVDLADSLFKRRPQLGEFFSDYYWLPYKYTVGGIVPHTKLTEFDRYAPFIYVPVQDRMFEQSVPVIAIRVNDSMEIGFMERFTSDMRNLAIGPFYFSQIKSYDESREIYFTQTNNYKRTAYAVVLFFVFNIFLTIIGTFWFRTQKRRGEIGLRMAVGASKVKIAMELIAEGILILMLSIIPGVLVCFNIWFAGITVNTYMDSIVSRFIIGIALTFLLMGIMILLGITYPAIQATKIEPAEALHEE